MMLLMMMLTTATAWAESAIGSIQYNSTGGYYEIGSVNNLNDLAVYVNGTGTYSTDVVETTAHNCSGLTFKMTANITYTHTTAWNDAESTENNFTAIGYDNAFRGTFDGQGHTISGIRIYKGGNSGTNSDQGLFGGTYDGATIRGIILTDARITGWKDTGGIVGSNSGTAIVSDCHVAADVTIHAVQSNANYHGGIVGRNGDYATVSYCTSAATLTKTGSGSDYGGIAGYNDGGTLSHNLAIGAVVPATDDNCHGAICGFNNRTLQNNYYFACTVAGVENATNVGTRIPHYSGLTVDYYYNGDVTKNDGAVNASPDNIELNNDGSYTIKTALGWDVFCDALQYNDTYNRFSGKTVKLGNDISVTRMAGTSGHDFCGTFDGQGYTLTVSYGTAESPSSVNGVAPFSYVTNAKANPDDANDSPAAIRNLNVVANINTEATHASALVGRMWGTLTIEGCTVSGTITTSAKYACGYIGEQNGIAHITNCKSSVAIKSSVEGDGTHGGFVGRTTGTSCTLTIEGCVFDGKLLKTGATATDRCGGFVGWRSNNEGAVIKVKNSLYAPAALEVGETWVSSTESATFVRNGIAGDITNCYYTTALGTAQGKQWFSVIAGEDVTVGHAGVATTYSVSGITAYKATGASGDDDPFIAGILYDDVLYAGSGDRVSLTLSNSALVQPGEHYVYSANGVRLFGNATDGHTLRMPDEDVTVSIARVSNSSSTYYLYLVFDEDDNTKATLVWDDPNGRPRYNHNLTEGSRWIGDANFDVRNVVITTLTVDESCQYYDRNNLGGLFWYWNELKTINGIGYLRTNDVTNMSEMFCGCLNLTSLDLSSWNVSNVTDMSYMFVECKNLETLDIRGWNTAKVTNTNEMFSGCSKLEKEVEAKPGESGWYWATFYDVCNYVIDYNWSKDAQVFKVALDGTGITMTEITGGIINSGEGVVLKNTEGYICLLPTIAKGDYTGNSLVGTTTSITNPGNAYVLNKGSQGVGFYKLKATGTIGENKAYLTYDGGSGAPEYFLFNEATGVDDAARLIDNGEWIMDNVVYDLQGRRVSQPTKGLYIVNGKKIVIK